MIYISDIDTDISTPAGDDDAIIIHTTLRAMLNSCAGRYSKVYLMPSNSHGTHTFNCGDTIYVKSLNSSSTF